MYVCICNAIRESDLRLAARRSCGDAEATYRCLGRTPQCRQCLEDAEDIIADERAAAGFAMVGATASGIEIQAAA